MRHGADDEEEDEDQEKMDVNDDDEEKSINEVKLSYERIFKLISLFSLVRQCQANDLDFNRLLQQQLVAAGSSPDSGPARMPALLRQMRALH